MKICAIALAGIFCLAALASDERPNFTGVWVRSGPSSSTTDKVEHSGANLKITYESSFSGGPIGVGMGGSETYTTDGAETAHENAATGRLNWVSAYWQGQSLVFLRVIKDGRDVTVTREEWALSQDGSTLTKKLRTINFEGVSEKTQVFSKH